MAKIEVTKKNKNKQGGKTLAEYVATFDDLTPKQKDDMLLLMAQLILEDN